MADHGQELAPRIEVKIDGKSKFGDAILRDGGNILYCRVEKSLDAPDSFEVRMNVLLEQNLIMIDESVDGKPIQIDMNIGEQQITVMKGEICYIEPVFVGGSADSYLSVSGYDRMHRLTRGHNARTWGDGFKEQDAYSDVANTVISDSASQDPAKSSDSLSADKVDSTSAKFTYIAQWNTSDYHFLRSLGMDAARPMDSDSATDDKKVSFRKLDCAGSPKVYICRDKIEGDPSVQCVNAHFRLSTVQQYKEVKVRGWDPATKKAIVGVATSGEQSFDGTPGWSAASKALYGGGAGRVYQVVDHPVVNQSEADQMAQAIFNRLALDYVTGEVEFQGFPGVEPGDMVELKFFGERFSGKYVVTGATHEVSRAEGYRTRLQIARNALP